MESNTNTIKLTRDQIKLLTPTEKVAYQRKMNVERQKRYKLNNKQQYDKYHKEYVKEYRKKHAEKYKELNKINSRNYRKRNAEIRRSLNLVS